MKPRITLRGGGTLGPSLLASHPKKYETLGSTRSLIYTLFLFSYLDVPCVLGKLDFMFGVFLSYVASC